MDITVMPKSVYSAVDTTSSAETEILDAVAFKQYYITNSGTGSNILTVSYGSTSTSLLDGESMTVMYDGSNWVNFYSLYLDNVPKTIATTSNVDLTSSSYPDGNYKIINTNASADIEITWSASSKEDCIIVAKKVGLFTKSSGNVYPENAITPSVEAIDWPSATIPSWGHVLDGSAISSGSIAYDLFGSTYINRAGTCPVAQGTQTIDTQVVGNTDAVNTKRKGALEQHNHIFTFKQQTGGTPRGTYYTDVLEAGDGSGVIDYPSYDSDGSMVGIVSQADVDTYTHGPETITNFIACIRYVVK